MEETNHISAETLNQITLIQSMVCDLPDNKSVLGFTCRGLEIVPGVKKTGYNITGNESIKANPVKEKDILRFILKSANFEFGELFIIISDIDLFSPYLPYIKNLCHMLSVIFEERRQRELNKAANDELEKRVLERTRELKAQIKKSSKTESALRLSEERLRLAMDATRDGLWDLVVETGEEFWSPRCYAMLGYEPDEFTINIDKWKELVHPDDLDQAQTKVEQALQLKNISFQIEYRCIKKDGSWLWIIDRGKPVEWDEQGNVKRMVGTHTDIDEKKRVALALKENEERLNAIFHTMPSALVVYDRNGIPQYLNPAFTQIFGWEFKEFKNKRIPFVPKDQMDLTNKKIKEVYATENPINFKSQRLTKKGRLLDVEINAKTIIPRVKSSQNGNFSGLVVSLTDITERKKIEEQLSQAQKFEAIGTLAGGIAHDFNNILGIIIGNTELALDDIPEWNQTRFNLDEIKAASLRARDVVKQLLSFARKSDLKMSAIKLQDIVKETLSLIRASIPKTIEIQTNIADDMGYVCADPTQMHQVLINVCTNASHAMEENGGILKVSLEEVLLDEFNAALYHEIGPGKYAQLNIADDGKGIEPEIIEKIFDPYFTTKEQGKGTGIGLAVVHGIVKHHGGAISAYSEPGKGTIIEVLLPVCGKVAEEIEEKISNLPLGTEKILLVDDEISIARMGKRILEKLGYQVETRTDPVKALNLVKNNPKHFDLVVTDMTMPGMTGDILSKEILKIRENIPIVLCTGFSEKINKDNAIQMGIAQYIEKPLDIQQLSIILRKALDKN